VALVHDYLTQRGGAERVFLLLAKAFADAPIYTSLYDPEGTFPGFTATDPICDPINRHAMLRAHHRLALPLLARTFSDMRIDAAVTLCSSSGWSHGVQTSGRKVVYCLSPAHWLYQTDLYFGHPTHPNLVDRAKSRLVKSTFNTLLARKLRRWDYAAARTADRYVTSSTAVATAIKDSYGIVAEIVPPPPALAKDGPSRSVAGVKPGFLLCVSRLKPYKNVRAIIESMPDCPGIELVVVGEGSEFKSLKKLPFDRVRLLGKVEDDELRWLYANAAGLVAASYEDFGLTPLEAGTFGKPVAVLRAGGFLDTVIEGRTGLFFDQPRPEQIAVTIRQLFARDWDKEMIAEHAATYSESGFISRIREIVAEEQVTLSGSPQAADAPMHKEFDFQPSKTVEHTNGHRNKELSPELGGS